MSLKTAIRDYQSHIEREIQGNSYYEYSPLQLTETAKVLGVKFESIGILPDKGDLKDVANRLLAGIQAGREISDKDMRKGAWCLWLKLEDQPLAHNTAFLEYYYAWLKQQNSKLAIKKLIQAYLYNFAEGDTTTKNIGDFLSDAVMAWPWIWRERHMTYSLFSPDAPTVLAKAALNVDIPIDDFLSEQGLKSIAGYSGMGACVIQRCISHLKNSSNTLFYKVMALAETAKLYDHATFRNALIEGLLLPWQQQSPPYDLQQSIQQFVLKYYRDPRFYSSGQWRSVDENAVRVIRQWLTKQSLDQFLQVVDRTADAETKRQWKYRRMLWNAYFEQGYITEAWVAFAQAGIEEANYIFKGKGSFGRITSGRKETNHAVLLLKIGSLTIADWSHNGSCRIYDPATTRPELYRTQYDAEDFRTTCSNNLGRGQPHQGSESGSWQDKVVDFIRQKTGINLPKYRYMMKGQ